MDRNSDGAKERRTQKAAGITYAGMTAALYTVLTLLSDMLALANGPVQIRISEALCVLPVFSPYAIPGLAIGCAVSGLLTGCLPVDILFGSIATLAAAAGTRMLRKNRYLCCLPPVIANGVTVPLLLIYCYGVGISYPLLMLSVGAGEAVSVFLFGQLLYSALARSGVISRGRQKK